VKHRPIAVLYEHPDWFRPLFAELDRRGLPYEPLHAALNVFDPTDRASRYSLVVNRMSPSAWTRGHAHTIFHTLHYLAYLDAIGTPVLNGYEAYAVELSKVRQATLISALGLPYPRTRVIDDPLAAPDAACDLTFPVLVKPNIGGSGAGIRSFPTPAELAAAAPTLELGLDGTGLVQEQLPAEGDSIVRVEILGGEFLYAIRIRLQPGSFNLCPADYCDPAGLPDPIEAYEPPPEVIEDARRIVLAAGMEVAGVEYLVNARDGRATFYDVNALSNFVADAPRVIGFDPFVQLVDLIAERAGVSSAIAA
jgi:glutathione synthase/RimK-type ligase-like ATP-grasp enzyme